MAINIDTELAKIMDAVYGEEVRGSIHDAIQKIAGEVDASDAVRFKNTFAPVYDSTDTSVIYNVGDYVYYTSGTITDLWRCQTQTTGGIPFDASNWIRIRQDQNNKGLANDIADHTEINQYRFDSVGGALILSGKSCDDLTTPGVWFVNKIEGVSTLTDFPIDGPGWIRVTSTNASRLIQFVYPSDVQTYPYILYRTKNSRVIDGSSVNAWTNWWKLRFSSSETDPAIAVNGTELNLNPEMIDVTGLVDEEALAQKLEEISKNQFIDGDYNITRHTNEAGKSTFVYWRYIPVGYEPDVAYSEDSVDYVAALANPKGATCAINASRFTSANAFYGYFRANGETIHENELTSSSNSRHILCYKNGTLTQMPVDTPTATLDAENYDWALTGFEAIIIDGQPTERATPGNTESTDYQPRSFIAQNYDGSYIIGCTDGRSGRSQGFRLSDIYSFLSNTGYNVKFAYSLDGGGSVALIEKGYRVNDYINNENRPVKSAIYFKKPGAYYDSVLKAATSNIDNHYRARINDYNYRQGDIYSYTNDSSATKQVSFKSLDTFDELAYLRLQANRFFIGFSHAFSSTGSAYNLIDVNRTQFLYNEIARFLPKLTNAGADYTDEIPNLPQTGISNVKISTSDVATSLGLTDQDYGSCIFITFRTNANFEILLTRANIWYRWDRRTWKRVQFVTS